MTQPLLNKEDKTQYWLDHWEEELDMDLSQIFNENKRNIIKIWVGNHIVHRYKELLKNKNNE